MSDTTELLKQWLGEIQSLNQAIACDDITASAITELSALYQKMQPQFADIEHLDDSDKALIEALQVELLQAFDSFEQMRKDVQQVTPENNSDE